MITFCAVWQGCGTDIQPPSGADVGVFTCPEVRCEDGLFCVDGQCVEPGSCEDLDGDGFGPNCHPRTDCDPNDSSVFPGAAELCNDVDDDCDGTTDEGRACEPCVPSCTPGVDQCSGDQIVRCDDSSGCAEYALPANCAAGLACLEGTCAETCFDQDGDGFFVDCPGQVVDCDDSNATVYPRAAELCDELDNNCDGNVDERGVCGLNCDVECELGTRVCTSDGTGYIECVSGGACPRWAAPSNCGSTRSCDDGACVDVVVCVDVDGDGAGPGCGTDDCRRFDAAARPGGTEVCNGVDDDCNGIVDDGGACTACVAAPANAPLGLTNNAITRVSCGGFEHFAVTGSGDLAAVVLGGDVTVQLGTVSGTAFVPAGSDSPLGVGHAAYAAASGAMVARVSAPAGTAYTLAVGVDTGACVADVFEPNGTPFAGTPLGVPPFALSATVCSAELDFYELDVTPGDVIDVSLAFEGEAGTDALTQVWRNGVAVSLASAGPFVDGTPQGRYSHFRADLPGSYTVGVRARGAGTAYGAAIQTSTVPCTDDAFETVGGLDDDTIATARALVSGGATGTLCPGDYDLIDLGSFTSGQTLDLTFEVLSGDNEVDFNIIHDTLSSLSYAGNTDTALSDVETGISTSGRYYLLVYGRTSSATGTYRYAQTLR